MRVEEEKIKDFFLFKVFSSIGTGTGTIYRVLRIFSLQILSIKTYYFGFYYFNYCYLYNQCI